MLSIQTPDQLSASAFKEFYEFVANAGEVSTEGLEGKMLRATRLITLNEGRKLIATAALKNPPREQIERIFGKADVLDIAHDFYDEIGWMVTAPEHYGKGIANNLLGQLVQSVNHNIFATTKIDNTPMHKIFKNNGFEKLGGNWKSHFREEYLSLHIKRIYAP